MAHFNQGLEQGKDMFDVYLSSVPVILNTMALAFGEVFYLEAYLRRIQLCKDAPTRRVFEQMGLLFGLWNIVERGGDFRTENLISSDQLNQAKERIMQLCSEIQPETIPLSNLPGWTWYNPFGNEDFYERFLGTITNAKGVFDKISNFDQCLQELPSATKKV